MTSSSSLRTSYDTVVVGGRCAGAATALLLARAGQHVLLVERGRYKTDTLSTHALMRAGVIQLQRWALLDAVIATGAPPVRVTSFHYGVETIAIPIKPGQGIDALYAPRRVVLDTLLADAARAAGAEVVFGTRAVDVIRSEDGRVAGVVLSDREHPAVPVRARVVVGADGAESTIAAKVGASTYRTGQHRTGVVYGYWTGLDVKGYEWHFQVGTGAGLIPTNDGAVCVFATMPARRFLDEIRFDKDAGYHRILREVDPAIEEAIASRGRLTEPLRGFAGQVGFYRQAWGPGWALVGDAGYFKDPLTAHGITDALCDAELLARAILEGSDAALANYQVTRDEQSMGLFDITDKIASFEWDLATVQNYHRVLSEQMKREVAWLTTFDALANG